MSTFPAWLRPIISSALWWGLKLGVIFGIYLAFLEPTLPQESISQFRLMWAFLAIAIVFKYDIVADIGKGIVKLFRGKRR